MARNKRNEQQVCSVEAVREAGVALMALIHPLCDLRTTPERGETTYTVIPQDPTARLMAAVADSAAEAVVPNSGRPKSIFSGVESLATSLEMAALILLEKPFEDADDEERLQTVAQVDGVTQAVAALFSRNCYRNALSTLARHLERGSKPTALEIEALAGTWLPRLDQVKDDVASVYLRMGWMWN
jgi:hypothetical protein